MSVQPHFYIYVGYASYVCAVTLGCHEPEQSRISFYFFILSDRPTLKSSQDLWSGMMITFRLRIIHVQRCPTSKLWLLACFSPRFFPLIYRHPSSHHLWIGFLFSARCCHHHVSLREWCLTWSEHLVHCLRLAAHLPQASSGLFPPSNFSVRSRFMECVTNVCPNNKFSLQPSRFMPLGSLLWMLFR